MNPRGLPFVQHSEVSREGRLSSYQTFPAGTQHQHSRRVAVSPRFAYKLFGLNMDFFIDVFMDSHTVVIPRAHIQIFFLFARFSGVVRDTRRTFTLCVG